MTMNDLVRGAITAALREVGGNRRKAVELLGIGKRTLYRKLKEYAIPVCRSAGTRRRDRCTRTRGVVRARGALSPAHHVTRPGGAPLAHRPAHVPFPARRGVGRGSDTSRWIPTPRIARRTGAPGRPRRRRRKWRSAFPAAPGAGDPIRE